MPERTAIYATTQQHPASLPTLSSTLLLRALEYARARAFCMDADLTSYRFTALVKRAGKPLYAIFLIPRECFCPNCFSRGKLSASERIHLFFIFIPFSRGSSFFPRKRSCAFPLPSVHFRLSDDGSRRNSILPLPSFLFFYFLFSRCVFVSSSDIFFIHQKVLLRRDGKGDD